MENKQTGAFPFIRAVTDFVFVSDAPEKVDVILIPGSRHPANAIRAAELYRAGYAPYVLPSGRHGAAVDKFIGVMPEDRAAYPDDYPDSAILREDEATFTWDNARKSAAVLKAQGISARTAILCCRPFHARRALLYYQTAMPETRFLVCPAREEGVNQDDWYLTQAGRTRVMGEVRRLGDQIVPQFEELCQYSGMKKEI